MTPFAFLVVVVLGALACVIIRAFIARGVPDLATVAERDVARRLWAARLISLVIAVVATVIVAQVGHLGAGMAVAPVIFGAVFVIGCAVGEMSVHGETATRRAASLRVRRVRDYIPRVLAGFALASALTIAALLVIGLTTADTDDVGRGGRSLRWSMSDGEASSGPWPGSAYALPITIALLLTLVAFIAGARTIIIRPSLDASATNGTVDDHLRRFSMRALVGALAVALGFELLGLGAVMASATQTPPAGSPSWLLVLNVTAWLATLLGLATLVAGMGSVLRTSIERS